jgi:hypothetical protein
MRMPQTNKKKEMNMKNVIKTLAVVVIAVVLGSCNNFFHSLIPPDEASILSFWVEGQLGVADISANSVTATVEKGSPVHNLIPRIFVSNKATLLPVTLDYVQAAFPSVDLVQTAMEMNRASDLNTFVMDLIKENPDFNVPELDIPIDFSGPITMLVVSARGTIRQYTVNVVGDTGEPRLLNVRFAKYDNPELLSDALCVINENTATVYANASYPMEMDYLSYALIPSFEILGDSFEVDGIPIVSGVGVLQFTQGLGTQTKTITITRDGTSKDYTLTVLFSEDPDSIRSITDFRFNKADNQSLAANAVASIINNDNTGTITVQVFYSSTRPSTLTPCFISPGTVSVGKFVQTSGVSSHDYLFPTEYRVVSKNGMYTRTYAVIVEYISVTDNAPGMTSFKFSAAFNPELVQDATARINDGLILIDAYYGGAYPPDTLIPEFRAEGTVTVYGSVQISGASPQDFFRQIKYTVTNPLNPLLTRDYWVQCRFVRDTSSDAAITSFGFYPEDNMGLADEVTGKIDQITSKITVYAPVGSGLTSKIMAARFTAAGQVSVKDTPQVSGQSGQMFDAPVIYTVVSANGANRRDYTVAVRELTSTMYVNQNAVGSGDGTSWENAFRYLQTACEAAAEFPDDLPKQIWIATGTYKPKDANDYFKLTPNTSYIGGFEGGETAKSQRNIEANPVIISGDLAGIYAKRLFNATSELNGDLSFENLRLSGVKGQQGACINALLNNSSEMTATDCAFEYLESSGTGGAIYVRGGGAVIERSTFYACTNGAIYVQGARAKISDLDFSTCMSGNVVKLDCTGETEITRINVEYAYGTVFYLTGGGNKTMETATVNFVGQCMEVRDTTGAVRVNNLSMQNIFGIGIAMNGANGVKRFSAINAANITSAAINSVATSGSFTLTDNSVFDNAGVISITNGSGMVSVQNTDIKNLNGLNGIRVLANNAVIDKVSINKLNLTVDESSLFRLTTPVGIYLDCSGRASLSNITIDDLAYSYYYNGVYYDDEDLGYGIQMRGGGTLSVVNSSIKKTYIAIQHSSIGDLEIDTLELKDIYYYGIYSSVSCSTQRNIQLKNITANNVRYSSINLYGYGTGKNVINIKDSIFENTAGISIYSNYETWNGSTHANSTPALSYIALNDSSIELSNIKMNNIDSTNNSNGAIYIGLKTVIMDRININRVYTNHSSSYKDQYGFDGRGIKINYADTVRISNSTIRNCQDIRYDSYYYYNDGDPYLGEYGWEGAGIFIQCHGTTEISNTTIEDVEACIGAGIYYCYSPPYYYDNTSAWRGNGTDSLTLRGVTIKNAKASYQVSYSQAYPCGYGGGLYFCSNGKLNIINTVMENCQSEVNNGAIVCYSSGNTITGSKFIGCTSAGNFPVLEASRFNAGGYTITP